MNGHDNWKNSLRKATSAASKTRVECTECGMISNGAGIDRHQQASNHAGSRTWVTV